MHIAIKIVNHVGFKHGRNDAELLVFSLGFKTWFSVAFLAMLQTLHDSSPQHNELMHLMPLQQDTGANRNPLWLIINHGLPLFTQT